MSRKKRIIKRALIVFTGLIVAVVGFGYWFMSLLHPIDSALLNMESTTPGDLSYVMKNRPPYRGKILAVVTSCGTMGESGKATGYEMSELARAYYVFVANGFEVDVASPAGGKPPVVIDDEDMGRFDHAFLNDTVAQNKVSNTLPMQDVNPDDYEAIYFVGGKGTLFDFPQNQHIQSIVRQYHEEGKVVGAVCHGPAALVNVKLNNGHYLLRGRSVSAFTNQEELFLIKDARSIFPFLLQDKLIENGADFKEGYMYLEQVVKDGNLITGQNPWSTWAVAEAMVGQLGYAPKHRNKTGEELSVEVLETFEVHGYDHAIALIDHFSAAEQAPLSRELLAVHSILAAMQWDVVKAVKIIGLLKYAKSVGSRQRQ
ncbi:type 1 glutamine amidotransferase domain-containing protein [Fulvivirga kasyanovii]|uniref:Type 1 glutamine amidotransferase domain-containing protein n=1 Tax=Fulvivirga kasyanovii TaxID=396812 RepID=A0ABW9RIJ8_9BACT|nr:type 1 glutamine amidotransferase domain-containing protein [Fulvivirga kasyanovii]MTI23888.1 type 1 glutamine amidotransferase domain-containing protein [Fulvivirga kasyanovii]